MEPMPDDTAGAGRGLRTWRGRFLAATVVGALTLAAAAGGLIALWTAPEPGSGDLAAALADAGEGADRKQAFIAFLRPVIRAENRRILRSRQRLLRLLRTLRGGGSLASRSRQWLAQQSALYRVPGGEPLARAEALKTRIDVVPVELALAQAALESGWGSSRFAREGNNLFGEWCFDPGCGIVPLHRPVGRTYEVKAFDGVAGSVRSYMHHLNSHPAYEPMRRIRAAARAAGRRPDGYEMAGGLVRYAAIGEEYVARIRRIIERYDLRSAAQAG